ncbi:hypothetical protein FKB34_01785 [Glycocaulis profundi]|nr:hypothetical protein FKB34_01785 [Glycocaulis profundi]
MDGARKEFQDGVDDLVRRSGPLGRFLQSIGPWGIAAAAGLGVAVGAFALLRSEMAQAREANQFMAVVRDIGQTADMSAREVLNLGTAVRLAGGDFMTGARAVEEWTKRLGRVRSLGQGETFDALKVLGLGPDDFRGMSAEQALDRVINRLLEIDDISSRIALADRLGLSGINRLLQQGADDARTIREDAESINRFFNDSAIQRMASMADEAERLETHIERMGQIAPDWLGQIELAWLEFRARVAEERGLMFSSLEDLSLEGLEERLERTAERIAELQRVPSWARDIVVAGSAELAEAQRQYEAILEAIEAVRAAERERALEARVSASVPQFADPGMLRGPWADPEAAARRDPDAGVLPLDQRRRLDGLIARELNSLLTPMERYEQLQRDINTAIEHELGLSREQGERILENARARLFAADAADASAEAEQRRYERLVETQLRGLMSHAQQAEELRRELEEAQRRGIDITDKQIAAAVERMIPAAERLLTPLERQKDLMESLIEPLDRLRERKADLQAVMAQYPEHADLVVMELRRVQTEIDEFEGRTSRFTGLARLAAESRDWDRQLEGVALGGLGAVERGLEDIVMQWRSVGDAVQNTTGIIISSLARIALQQAIIGPIAGGLFSRFGGSTSGASAGGMNLGWSLPGGAGSVYHSGTAQAGHGFGPVRPMTGLDPLPRFHSGRPPLGSGEMGAIIEREERIFSASDNRALIESINYATRMSRTAAAAAATGQGQAIAVELHINGEKQSGNVRARRTPGGGVRLDVQLKGAVAGLIEGGAMDGAMSKRFGLRPSART